MKVDATKLYNEITLNCPFKRESDYEQGLLFEEVIYIALLRFNLDYTGANFLTDLDYELKRLKELGIYETIEGEFHAVNPSLPLTIDNSWSTIHKNILNKYETYKSFKKIKN